MNHRIIAAWKPLAVLGLALALAGCNKTENGGVSSLGSTSTSGSDTLATVGDTPIMRTDLTKLLEAQSGEQVLPVLIDTQLLLQAGKDAGITVSDADVTAELDKQKKLDPQLAEALTKNPALVEVISPQIRRNLVVQRLLTKDVKYTDADLQKFFNTYKSYYQDPAKVKVGTLLTSTKARADAMSRALKANTKTFDQLVAEQKKAQDPLAANSSDGENFAPVDTLELVYGPDEAKAIENLPKGGTTEPREIKIPNAPPVYVLFHVTDKQAATSADFAKLKPEIETDYKMAQVAKEEVKKNPANPPFDETLKRTRDSLRNPQNPAAPAPSLRDALTTILRPMQQNYLTDLRGKGLVKIDDSRYASVADQYKAVPTPVPPSADANAAAAPATNSAAPAPATNSAAPAAATNSATP